MRKLARRLRRWKPVVAALMGIVFGMSVSATASHLFSDVPDSSIAHGATEWLFNRAITLGCVTGMYCPDAFVTRAQMALFMQRLGLVFTDHSFGAPTGSGAPIDPDSSPMLCVTPDYTPTFPEWAFGTARVALLSDGAMNTQLQAVMSTDGGATWTILATGGAGGIEGASVAGVWYNMRRGFGPAMNPGTTYRFAVRVLRVSGTADATDFRCSLGVGPVNRNPAISPLRSGTYSSDRW